MRMSREAMAEHHREIVAAGARMLRERGIEGVSVAELMQAAGLTHGGFYRHFASKDAFVAEASTVAFADVARMRNGAGGGSDVEAMAEFIDFYLGAEHFANPGIGCPIAAYGSEISRASPEVRAAFAQGVSGVLAWIEAHLPGDAERNGDKAAQILSTLVGAVVASRSTSEATVAQNLLRAAKAQALALVQSCGSAKSAG